MEYRKEVKIQLIYDDFHFLHNHVQVKDSEPRLLTTVYASSREHERCNNRIKMRDLA